VVSEIATIEVFCTPVGKRQSFSPPSSSSQITNVEPFSELASGFMQSLIFELPTDKRVDSRKEEQLKVQILRGEEKKKEKNTRPFSIFVQNTQLSIKYKTSVRPYMKKSQLIYQNSAKRKRAK